MREMQETQVESLGQEDAPGGGNGNPLQCSCLENPMDGGTKRATVHGVARVGHDLGTKQPPPHTTLNTAVWGNDVGVLPLTALGETQLCLSLSSLQVPGATGVSDLGSYRALSPDGSGPGLAPNF